MLDVASNLTLTSPAITGEFINVAAIVAVSRSNTVCKRKKNLPIIWEATVLTHLQLRQDCISLAEQRANVA